jgi:hypothetical protein
MTKQDLALGIARLSTKLQVAVSGETHLRSTDSPLNVMNICRNIREQVNKLESLELEDDLI